MNLLEKFIMKTFNLNKRKYNIIEVLLLKLA